VVDSLSRTQPQFRFLLVATDYFTKWIKVVPLSEVTGQQVVKFLRQNLVCCFDFPHTIISNNGTTSSVERWLHSAPSTRPLINSLRHTTHEAMTKLRSAFTTFSKNCARALVRRKANRLKSFRACSGNTGPLCASLWERLCFHYLIEQRPTSQSTFACRHRAQKKSIGTRMSLSFT